LASRYVYNERQASMLKCHLRELSSDFMAKMSWLLDYHSLVVACATNPKQSEAEIMRRWLDRFYIASNMAGVLLLACAFVANEPLVAQEKSSPAGDKKSNQESAVSDQDAKKKAPLANEVAVFDQVEMVLAFEAENELEKLKEYIPKGETLEKWQTLSSVRIFKKMDDPKQAVIELGKRVKEQNPLSQQAIMHNAKSNEACIDFITWPEDTSFVEFNIFKYAKNKEGGLIAYQFAMRRYDKDEQKAFIIKLRDLRKRLVTEMANQGLVVKPGE
jgi:hypothetical protein